MNEIEKLNFKFEYTDEFNQTTKFEQNLNINNLESTGNLDIMVQEFKLFLYSLGYSKELVDTVQIIDNQY
jgi:hypothetical protein